MIGGRWTGHDEASKILEQIVSEVARDEVVAGAMIAAARDVVLDMRDRAPRRSPAPDMADSIAVARSTEGAEDGVVVVKIGPRRSAAHSWIAKLIEFGTSKMPAQPFMRPTWDEYEQGFSNRIAAAMQPAYKRAVARYARRTA